jgi:hypothetical protein
MPQVDFGEWLPDQQQVSTPGLRSVVNLSPARSGWQGVSSLVDTELSALVAACRGAFRGRTQSGTDFILVGTEDGLYENNGFAMAELSGATYTLSPTDRWDLDVYGNARFATNRNNPVQRSASPGVQFADVSAHASLARALAVVGEFLMLGDIVGQGDNASAIGSVEGGLHWCALGDPTDWPQVGSAEAINKQSDFQVLEGDGGPVKQIVQAAEYTAVFRQRQVWRADYVGAPSFFRFRKIDDSRGAIVPGTAIAVGNFVYFLSAEGFLVFNGARTEPIGFEKVDRTILEGMDWERADAHCSVSHNAALRSIVWSLPQIIYRSGGGGGGGWSSDGNTLLGYNYDLQQFWAISQDNEWVFNAPPLTEDLSMDGPVYGPKVMDDPLLPATPGGLGDQNMDQLGGGTSQRDVLSVFKINHQAASFAGDSKLVGEITTGDFEGDRRRMVRAIRPVFQGYGADISGTVFGKDIAGGSARSVTTRSMVSSGVIPARAAGRYHWATFTTAGPIRDFQGFDYVIGRMGKR